ncbi:MAG: carbamoyltransferase HypF [Granulosicoccus sp.]|nr:carbamoyltransferase HypF [Granulosicoccus sp.]
MPDYGCLPVAAPRRVLACGAYLKNRACLVDGIRLCWSVLHGDLGETDSCLALEQSVDALIRRADGEVHAIAHDLHPDFFSTRLALAVADRLGIPAVAVQHHHAHIAAVIAARGISQPVIGIALDGVGLGVDGQAWGGEILRVDGGLCAQHWQRLAALHPLQLPGGDSAAREPWRIAAGLLHDAGRSADIMPRFAPHVGQEATRIVRQMLERGVNCPSTSSAGRWFDAAAAALGLSLRQHFEAEAAMALEQCASDWLRRNPRFDQPWCSLDLRSVVNDLFDISASDPPAVGHGAATFHLALANGLAHTAINAAHETGVGDIVFAGGCFMNTLLCELLQRRICSAGLRVHVLPAADCGDSAIGLGQAWVAACTLTQVPGVENH